MKYFLPLFMLSCFVCTALSAISPPAPKQGSPSILTSKFSTRSGPFLFKIDVPSQWGLGATSVTPDGKAHFELYPKKGGNGCMIEVKPYNNFDEATSELTKIRKKIKKAKDLEDGFESEFSEGWFSCRVNGQSLIQTWYMLSKKKSEHKSHWKSLKNCIHVQKVEEPTSPNEESSLISENTQPSWRFNHPTIEKKIVLFELSNGGTLNEDNTFSYRLSFDDIGTNATGYFYLEWDQTSLDTADPYQKLCDKMLQDMKRIEPGQLCDPIEIHLEKGYAGCAIMRGYPYGIIVVSGDDFLVGFAVKSYLDEQQVDVFALLDKVKWHSPGHEQTAEEMP